MIHGGSFLVLSHTRTFACVESVSRMFCLLFNQPTSASKEATVACSWDAGTMGPPTSVRCVSTLVSSWQPCPLTLHVVIICLFMFFLFLPLKQLAYEGKGQFLTHHSVPNAYNRPSMISINKWWLSDQLNEFYVLEPLQMSLLNLLLYLYLLRWWARHTFLDIILWSPVYSNIFLSLINC